MNSTERVPAAAPAAVAVAGLSKTYRWGFLGRRSRQVLDGLNLDVRAGGVFGYLGPNGSGKTSTIKIVMGLMAADAGSVRVLGLEHHDRAWRFRVGYLPENPYLYDYLTAGEYLDYVGQLFGQPRALRRERTAQLLEKVGLGAARHVAMRRYSKGMLQRAGLAQALMNDPELVFLDEPMSGLDPIGRRLVSNLILEMKAQGKTVFFSTHILSDAETLCDGVAVLRGGRLLAQGRLDEILNFDVSHLEVLVSGLSDEGAARLSETVTVAARHGERHRLHVGEGGLAEAIRALEQAGARVLLVQPVRQSLEEFFFKELGTGTTGEPWQALD